MISAADLKVGVVFEYNGEPCKVLEYKHTHMARGSADVRLKIRGLISGNVIPVVISPSMKFEEAVLMKKPMQFLYRDREALHFMDPKDFEQIELKSSVMGENSVFLKDGETYEVLYWDEIALDVLVPPKVDLVVMECDPGIKGNSAANMYKSATLAGGVKVKVPLFIKKGEKVRVETANRTYVGKAKS